MARQHMGRHRAPDYSPLNEIADIAARSAQPAMKASAVAVASGGLVATFALGLVANVTGVGPVVALAGLIAVVAGLAGMFVPAIRDA